MFPPDSNKSPSLGLTAEQILARLREGELRLKIVDAEAELPDSTRAGLRAAYTVGRLPRSGSSGS